MSIFSNFLNFVCILTIDIAANIAGPMQNTNSYKYKTDLQQNTNMRDSYYGNSTFEAGDFYELFPGEDAHLIENFRYFTKLYSGYGLNDCDVCTIISMQILLGYYDTYLNDTIVDEIYDIPSICWLGESIDDFDRSPSTGKASAPVDNMFRDYLIDLMSDVTGHNPVNCGATTEHLVDTLSAYFEMQNIGYSLSYCTNPIISGITHTTENMIKNAINNNRPVIALGKSHASVAFGYDDDFVYAASGYGSRFATPWSTYTMSFSNLLCDAAAIDVCLNCDHIHSNNYFSSFNSTYLCPCGAQLKYESVSAEQFGFEPQYFFYEKNKTVTTSTIEFSTKRLRTGFIENECINLSPRRQGAGIAYLEFYFSSPIRSMSFITSLWSEYENVDGASAYVEVQDEWGDWEVVFDLFNDTYLPTDRTSPNYVELLFPIGISNVRFVTYNQPIGDRNKGRISLFNFEICYEKN